THAAKWACKREPSAVAGGFSFWISMSRLWHSRKKGDLVKKSGLYRKSRYPYRNKEKRKIEEYGHMEKWKQLIIDTERGIFEVFTKGEGPPLCVTHHYSIFNETGDYFAETFTPFCTVYLVN